MGKNIESTQYKYQGEWLSKREILNKAKPIKMIGVHTYYGKCYGEYEYAIIDQSILRIKYDSKGEHVRTREEVIYI